VRLILTKEQKHEHEQSLCQNGIEKSQQQAKDETRNFLQPSTMTAGRS
jgi:hypothetical protein